MFTTAIIFSIHSNFIRNNYKEKYTNNNVSDLMHNVHGGFIYEGDKVAVKPNFESRVEHAEEDLLGDIDIEQPRREASISDLISELEQKI